MANGVIRVYTALCMEMHSRICTFDFSKKNNQINNFHTVTSLVNDLDLHSLRVGKSLRVGNHSHFNFVPTSSHPILMGSINL